MTESPSSFNIKGIIEVLLFISEKPVMLEQIKDVLGEISTRDIRDIILELQKEYEERKSGMIIVEIAGGYQMLSNPEYASAIRKFYKTRHKEKLSRPALETLAIIAYKQPVSRSDIELIRGVNSDGVTAHLFNKGLIKIAGRKDIPGRPYLYGTTKEFLEYFGLKSLEDLPKLEDFTSLQPAADQEGQESPEAVLNAEQSKESSGASRVVEEETTDGNNKGTTDLELSAKGKENESQEPTQEN